MDTLHYLTCPNLTEHTTPIVSTKVSRGLWVMIIVSVKSSIVRNVPLWPWPGGSVGWSITNMNPCTKRLWVQYPAVAHMGSN